jgi:hypothetical protein
LKTCVVVAAYVVSSETEKTDVTLSTNLYCRRGVPSAVELPPPVHVSCRNGNPVGLMRSAPTTLELPSAVKNSAMLGLPGGSNAKQTSCTWSTFAYAKRSVTGPVPGASARKLEKWLVGKLTVCAAWSKSYGPGTSVTLPFPSRV